MVPASQTVCRICTPRPRWGLYARLQGRAVPEWRTIGQGPPAQSNTRILRSANKPQAGLRVAEQSEGCRLGLCCESWMVATSRSILILVTRGQEHSMRRILVATLAGVVVTLPAHAQLIGQPSGQGGAPPPRPARPLPRLWCRTRRLEHRNFRIPPC